ncbi:hypothetical protein [Oscillibacter sp.]|uniref:hypothetical protein n=1 Tax=Oscillibacter sp. TaxID=1945593 RepID=UPI0028AF3B2F|nr:hypothetical protein [Oscillibacter sp.]
MAKRKMPGWAGFLEGATLALGLYIGFQCLLALLTLKGVMPEEMAFRFQAASGVLASCAGGTLSIRRTEMGPLWAALGSAVIFTAALTLGGILLCDDLVWSGESMILLAAALVGGLLAVVPGRKSGKRKKQSRTGLARRVKVGKKS